MDSKQYIQTRQGSLQSNQWSDSNFFFEMLTNMYSPYKIGNILPYAFAIEGDLLGNFNIGLEIYYGILNVSHTGPSATEIIITTIDKFGNNVNINNYNNGKCEPFYYKGIFTNVRTKNVDYPIVSTFTGFISRVETPYLPLLTNIYGNTDIIISTQLTPLSPLIQIGQTYPVNGVQASAAYGVGQFTTSNILANNWVRCFLPKIENVSFSADYPVIDTDCTVTLVENPSFDTSEFWCVDVDVTTFGSYINFQHFGI